MRVQTRKSGRVTDTSCRTRPFPIIRRTAKHRSPRIDSSRCCCASREAMPDWRSATIGKAARRVKPARQKGLGWRARIGPNDGEEIPPRIVDELEIGERAAADDDEVGKRARRERSGACSGGRRRAERMSFSLLSSAHKSAGMGWRKAATFRSTCAREIAPGMIEATIWWPRGIGSAVAASGTRWRRRRPPRSGSPAPGSRGRPARSRTSRREWRRSREFLNCSRRRR